MKRGVFIVLGLFLIIVLTNVIYAAEPYGIRISPVNSSSKVGVREAFVALYIDSDGYDNIYETRVRFLGKDGNKKRVVLRYSKVENKVYVRDNSGSSPWIGGYIPGSNNLLESSYVEINVSRIVVENIDKDKLKVRWPVTFKENFTGNYSVELYVSDINNSNYNDNLLKNFGTWNVVSQDTQKPPCISQTCSELGKTCGTWDNGCGTIIDCGECPPPTPSCGNNQCETGESCSSCSQDCGSCPVTCIDNDNDNYNSNGGSCGAVDCNDNNNEVNPGKNEVCYNNIDDNCNGIINEGCGVSSNGCSGCLFGNSCYSIGIRIVKDNEPSYCDVNKTIKSQKNLDSSCENNFECKSNECSVGKCIFLEGEVQELKTDIKSLEEEVQKVKSEVSFFKKLLCGIKDFLGIQGYNECIEVPPTSVCGNNQCETGESCSSCSQDCGSCPPPAPVCGDNVCNGEESCSSCSQDCGSCPVTCTDNDKDGYGNPASNTCTFSQLDCNDNNNKVNPGIKEVCTNAIDDDCDGKIDSSDSDCVSAVCGNAQCETGESCSTCSKDCGSCPITGKGIWISKEEIMKLPMSGDAWTNVKSEADKSACSPDLSNQDDNCNIRILAKALVYARTGDTKYLNDVKSALTSIANSGTYNGRALALGRELGAYVISADIIDLKNTDSALDSKFRDKIKVLLTTPTTGGPSNLIKCHEDRPNNWGTNCGASRIAVDLYLGDKTDLEKAAGVFKGWLGDRTSYAGFSYGELTWQCDPTKPVGINPKGCIKEGHSIDGVLPDDQRRSGSFSWPPPKENYVYGGLGGALIQAVILSRQGYDVWNWQDKALLRAFQWTHNEANFPPASDDTWQSSIINHYYNTNFPASVPSSPGKNTGWTDWTHAK